MKNKGLVALLSLLMFSTVTMSRPAHAVVGVVAGQPSIAVTGLVMVLGGGFLYRHALDQNKKNYIQEFLGISAGVFGLFLLDENQSAVSFKPLTQEIIASKGITEEQNKIYEASLPELNAVFESIQALEVSETQAAQLWSEALSQFNPELELILKLAIQ